MLFGADVALHVGSSHEGKADIAGAGAPGADRTRLALVLGELRHGQWAVPPDLGAAHLPAVVVDVEVVAGEALVATVPANEVARQRPGDRDLVLSGRLFQVDHAGVTAADQVLGRQQASALQPGVDAGQHLSVVRGNPVVATSMMTLTPSDAQASVR